MSVVLQESVLFSGTIADNIRICRPDASQAELEQAAQLAGALAFIRELPQGFEQQVGEGSPLVGRAAPAHCPGPRPAGQPQDPAARRGHLGPRL